MSRNSFLSYALVIMRNMGVEVLFSILGALSFGGALGGGIVYFFIKSFLPNYLSEKAKNLATKEDVESITDKVEAVKSDYAHLLEEVKSNNQLKLASVEREKNIKKEVYMEAVEAITRSQNMIASFCNLDLKEAEITSSMSTDAGKVAKVQVVGGEETVRHITEYMSEIGSACLDLMLNRSGLVSRKNLIEINVELRNKKQQEIDRYIEIMKSLNLQGNSDRNLWDVVKQNVDFEQKEYDKYQAEVDSLQSVQNKEHLTFVRECMERFFKISMLLPPIVIAVREELDLKISTEDYLDIFKNNNDKGKTVFTAFLKRIEESSS